jgi:enoyl-CoA hydratase/carnithine racemase
MSELIKSGRDGAVATNVLTLEMLRALTAAIKSAAASDAKVIVLRSTGSDFCRGRDPKGGPANPTALVMRDQVLQPILDVYAALNDAPQPTVCAVQGAALGFGCAMATACDVTIAADNATFKLPEMTRNLPPTLAISALLPKVPRKALAWMVYAMPELDAKTALQIGIASAVVPLAELEDALAETLKTITARSPSALNAVKEYLRNAPMMEPRGAAAYGVVLLSGVLGGALSASRHLVSQRVLVIFQINILPRLGQPRLAAAVASAQIEHGAHAIRQDSAMRR